MWAHAPADTVSVRKVVQKADSAQAAIHYHFGDMERLYLEASIVALADAEDWMATRLDEIAVISAAGLSMQLQASVLASTIADWCAGQRKLAMALRYAPGADWQTAWHGFWFRLAEEIGLEKHAATVAFFAAGETARHLLVWNPALDRALLDETCAALVLWLTEQQMVPDDVRAKHQDLTRSQYDRPERSRDVLADKIERAASELLAEHGHSGVTFRAVAARADVTLGKVIHLCGSKSELLHRALNRLYEREALGGNREEFVAQSFPPQVMLDYLIAAIMAGDQPVLRAYDEIERAIYNGPDHAALRGVVRSMDDPSGTWALQQMLDGRTPTASLVAVFSAIIRGAGYQVAHSAMPDDDMSALSHQALAPFRL